MLYDTVQLKKDLKLIASFRGVKKQTGYFINYVYEDPYIKIFDDSRDPTGPKIFLNGMFLVEYDELYTVYGLGEHILNIALNIDEWVFFTSRVDI